MVETLIAIILLPFAALAATVTIIFATGLVMGIFKGIFRGGKKNGTNGKEA